MLHLQCYGAEKFPTTSQYSHIHLMTIIMWIPMLCRYMLCVYISIHPITKHRVNWASMFYVWSCRACCACVATCTTSCARQLHLPHVVTTSSHPNVTSYVTSCHLTCHLSLRCHCNASGRPVPRTAERCSAGRSDLHLEDRWRDTSIAELKTHNYIKWVLLYLLLIFLKHTHRHLKFLAIYSKAIAPSPSAINTEGYVHISWSSTIR